MFPREQLKQKCPSYTLVTLSFALWLQGQVNGKQMIAAKG